MTCSGPTIFDQKERHMARKVVRAERGSLKPKRFRESQHGWRCTSSLTAESRQDYRRNRGGICSTTLWTHRIRKGHW